MNHGSDSLNYFTLILAGKPYLNNNLEKPVHEALNQRITVRKNFGGLKDHEIADYIPQKLTMVGASRSILGDSSISAIHGYYQ